MHNSTAEKFCDLEGAISFYVMIGRNTLLYAAGGIIAYSLLTKAKALQTLNFYPKGVRSLHFDGITPVISLALAVQNTSGQQMVLKSFAGNVFANDYFVGNVSSYIQTVIYPNSESVLLVNVRLSLIGIASNIVNAFNGNGPAQDLELDAMANVDNYQLPVKIKYKVGL